MLIFARPHVIEPHCLTQPENCSASTLNSFDRPALGLDSTEADQLSYLTQNLSGAIALTVPPLWNGALFMLGKATPAMAIAQTGVDLVLLAQTASWNGAFNEAARLISQRPRPYVYSRPREAENSANYTSFYSGHTSFSAAVMIGLFLVLLGRSAPTGVLVASASLAQVLIFATAAFRVLAGRHFITDVLIGALAGSLVAFAVAYLHRPKTGVKEISASAEPLITS